MLRITIEMVPASGGDPYLLAEGIIANNGQGTQSWGSYVYGLSAQVQRPGNDAPITRSGVIHNFPRLRQDCWELLRRCLEAGNQNLIAPDGIGYVAETEE